LYNNFSVSLLWGRITKVASIRSIGLFKESPRKIEASIVKLETSIEIKRLAHDIEHNPDAIEASIASLETICGIESPAKVATEEPNVVGRVLDKLASVAENLENNNSPAQKWEAFATMLEAAADAIDSGDEAVQQLAEIVESIDITTEEKLAAESLPTTAGSLEKWLQTTLKNENIQHNSVDPDDLVFAPFTTDPDTGADVDIADWGVSFIKLKEMLLAGGASEVQLLQELLDDPEDPNEDGWYEIRVVFDNAG